MDAAEFKRLGHQLIDQLAEAMASVPAGPVMRNESPTSVRRALDLEGPLPEHGTDAATIFKDLTPRLFEHSLFNAHPRFFGYITAPPAPIGVLGDLIASGLNANVGSWILSPAATEIEAQTIRWISEFIGFGPKAGGLLVSGGNMANMVCFWAARVAKAKWNIRTAGLEGSEERLRVYTSVDTHTWIQKATDLSGLGTDAIRWIETDEHQRMNLAALREAIAEDRGSGDVPFMVIGTGGSVGTGAIDALEEIAQICREHELWFHVDGAYGGFAAGLPDAPASLRALRLADSVAVDPHKWLYAPLEAGCSLVRDPEALTRAFAYHPAYFHWEESATNFVELGPQNSRSFRALKVWLALRQAGAAGYRRMIGDDVALSRYMAEVLRKNPAFEVTSQSLSITTFRYVPEDRRSSVGTEATERYLNELNADLNDRIQKSGEAFVSNAVIRGRYVLRACIVNFHTTRADVDALPEIVARIGRAVDSEKRRS
jgi:glutamate/tyrosine decarboxylase-like PLP-dependent enzyme